MTRTELLAALTATAPTDSLYTDAGYLDWTTRTADGGVVLDVGTEDGAAVQLELTRAELEQLHQQLTLTLLATR